MKCKNCLKDLDYAKGDMPIFVSPEGDVVCSEKCEITYHETQNKNLKKSYNNICQTQRKKK